MKMKKLLVGVLSIAVILTLTACGGKNQATNKDSATKWPQKPVQMIVPYPAGGDTDFNARVYATKMEKVLGKPVVVVNVVGGGGTVASNQVKNASNDGYTLLFYHSAMFVNQASGATNFGLEAFELSAILGQSSGNVLCVNSQSPYKILKEFIEGSKNNPGKVTYASNVNTIISVLGAKLNRAGADLNLVDVGGASERIPALLGGHVSAIPNALGSAMPYIKSGDFRALALLEEERNPLVPDLATAKEQGYDISFPTYYFAVFPKGTDPAIVKKFGEAAEQISKDQSYQKEIRESYQQQVFFKNAQEGKVILEKVQKEALALKDMLAANKK